MAHVMRDPEFQKKLLAFICRDRNFLRDLSHILDADDFSPVRGEGYEIHTIAKAAIDFWNIYKEPIGPMLRIEMLDYADKRKLGDKSKRELLDLVEEVQQSYKLIAVDAVKEKVIDYKKNRLKKKAVEKILELQEKGELTDEKWYRIALQAVEIFGSLQTNTVDYFASLEQRIERRKKSLTYRKYPYLLIDPLDEAVRTIQRGQLGLILALYKMGKSIMFNHVGLAYMFQGLNVLHITLEDPLDMVEDRYDAAITGIMTKRLADFPNKFTKRFRRQRAMIKSRLKIIDGTEGGWTVPRIEQVWEQERNKGFPADAILVDYDDEMEPVKKREGENARRMEFSDIYKDYRKFIAKRNLFGWIAAQTKRQGEGRKIVTAGMVAEDISKVRKVAFCLGIGQGEWGTDSRYLNVAANKNDIQGVGWNVMSDLDRAMIYDRDATLRRMALERKKNKKKFKDDEE